MKLFKIAQHIIIFYGFLGISLTIFLTTTVLLENSFGASTGFTRLDNIQSTLSYKSSSAKFSIDCNSDSMGIALRCGDIVEAKQVSPLDGLYYGKIYIYTSNERNQTHRVIHRLVGCADPDWPKIQNSNCLRPIFKGDNNAVAEIIDRNDITHQVTNVQN